MSTSVAMLVGTINTHGIRRMVASFVRPQENGELFNIQWDRFGDSHDVRHLANFEVTAYVGESFGVDNEPGRIWGLGYGYHDVHTVSHSEHARDMASTLGRIERGLVKLNESAGYVADGDFHAHAMRIASILKVKDVYVRNLASAERMSGERNRKVNGSALQWHVASIAQHAAKREFAELNERN